MGSGLVDVVDLEDGHVAAVAAVPGEEAPGRRARTGLDRRDHLEERVAHRKHRVAEPELTDARIGERLTRAELAVPHRSDRGPIGRRYDGLA